MNAFGAETVGVVVGGVFLGPAQRAAESGDEVGDGDAELPPEGGVACGDVPDFVSDDEAECREVPVADPDFEQVAGDRHIAAETRARRQRR